VKGGAGAGCWYEWYRRRNSTRGAAKKEQQEGVEEELMGFESIQRMEGPERFARMVLFMVMR